MTIIDKIVNASLYAGISKEEYKKVRDIIAESNRNRLFLYSAVWGGLVSILIVLSFVFPIMKPNVPTYIGCLVASIIFGVISYGPARHSARHTYALMYCFMATILIAGISLGIFANPGQASVSFCVLMFANPLMFSDRPLFINTMTVGGIIVYILIARMNLSDEMFAFNMSVILPYGAIILIVTTFLMQMKLRSFVLQDKTEMIDEIQTLNRELVNARDKENDNLQVIKHLATAYSAIYFIDYETGLFVEVGKTHLQYVENLIGGAGDAQDRLNAFVNNIVKPEFREDYSKFVQLDDVREKLKDRQFISKSYQGTTGWSEGSFIAGERGKDGYCEWVFWAVRNINEQKKIELKQQAELERHYAVIRATSQRYFCAYSLNLEKDRFVEVFSKPHITTVLGKEGVASEFMEKAWRTLVMEEDRALSKDFHNTKTWNDNLLYGDIYTCDFRGVQSGWVRGTVFAAKRNEYGKVTHVIYTMEMIHEQKAAEQALERAKKEADAANKAKTSFLFNMSHDIRTPMNAIIGFTNLLRKHQDNEERRNDYLEKIEGSGKVLLSIINNVLEMARIEKGTIQLKEEPTLADEFNDTLSNIFFEMMKSKGLTFTCSADVQHNKVYVDTTKLREVFYNILSNSYKYTERGSVTMTLKEIPGNREGYAVYQTTITDTGMGMSEDFLPHLFEEFSREDDATDNKIEGTGLGMPIVKRLVELMEGTIEVKSQKGVGTTFVVTLPHKIAEDAEINEVAAVAVDPSKFEGKRILLTEDNDLNAEIAMEILSEVGFVVERADDGSECVKMMENVEAGYYDVILMDIQMPKMNGYEATRAIRQMEDAAKANIPILAMTANAFEEDSRRSLDAGMNGHLAKPIDVAELMRTLAKVI